MHRVPVTTFTSQPWRIHELTSDFRVEDVWALPTPGGADDFPRLLEAMRTLDLHNGGASPIARLLFAVRWKLGALLGWDREDQGIGRDARVSTLRERLPLDLRRTPVAEVEPDGSPFDALYVLDDEYAAELANATMHGVAHLGWVADPDTDEYHAQLAVLVRPNGVMGRAYMALIKPFRYLLVYPALGRSVGRAWQNQTLVGAGTPASTAPTNAAT